MDRFTNFMIQYPFPTASNERTKYSNDIRQVIKQACKQLYILLQNITTNYKKLGIAHNPTQFYQAIFRIITPLQLLNQHQITTQFLYSPQERLVRPEKITTFIPNFKQEQKQIFKQQQKVLRMDDVEDEFDGEKNGWESNQAQSHFNQDVSNKRKRRNQNGSQRNRGGCGVTNKIDHEMEKAVYEWAMQCFKNWKRLQMVDICRYAKQVSKNAIFLASSGWCANFLNRHPDLKTLVKSRHSVPKQQNRRTPQRQQQESRQLLQTAQTESQIKQIPNKKAERGNPIHPNPLYSRDPPVRQQPQTTRNRAIKYPENNKRNYMGINSDNEQDYLNYGNEDGDEDDGYGGSQLRNGKDELSEEYGYGQGNGDKSVKMEGIVDNQGYNYYENKM